jgi:hypothetical protein
MVIFFLLNPKTLNTYLKLLWQSHDFNKYDNFGMHLFYKLYGFKHDPF